MWENEILWKFPCLYFIYEFYTLQYSIKKKLTITISKGKLKNETWSLESSFTSSSSNGNVIDQTAPTDVSVVLIVNQR